MIVVETVLRDIFSQLPVFVDNNSKSFTIQFEWGDKDDLNLYLEQQKGSKYPLLWLQSNKQRQNRYTHSAARKTRLFIAKNTEHKTNRNPKVWDTEFNECLNPILANVLKAIEKSGVTSIANNGEYEEERLANYTSVDLGSATDVWNMIILDIDILFTEGGDGEPNCINQIRF